MLLFDSNIIIYTLYTLTKCITKAENYVQDVQKTVQIGPRIQKGIPFLTFLYDRRGRHGMSDPSVHGETYQFNTDGKRHAGYHALRLDPDWHGTSVNDLRDALGLVCSHGFGRLFQKPQA